MLSCVLPFALFFAFLHFRLNFLVGSSFRSSSKGKMTPEKLRDFSDRTLRDYPKWRRRLSLTPSTSSEKSSSSNRFPTFGEPSFSFSANGKVKPSFKVWQKAANIQGI